MADGTSCANERCTGVHHHKGCVLLCRHPDGCDTRAVSWGLCDKHYRRARKEAGHVPRFRECTYPGCGRPWNSHGLCMTHWRHQREGRPLAPIPEKRIGRVEQYVRAQLASRERGAECWLDWPYGRSTEITGSRPVFNAWRFGHSKVMLARFVMFVENGEWPTWACHRCPLHPNGENGKCWNPAHLYDGDAKTNGRDRAGRKRGPRKARV